MYAFSTCANILDIFQRDTHLAHFPGGDLLEGVSHIITIRHWQLLCIHNKQHEQH